MPPQAPAREPGHTTKIGKNVFTLWPVPAMKSFTLTPLFSAAFGRAARQIALTVQASGFLSSKEAEDITISDVEKLLTGGDVEKGSKAGDVIKAILLQHGPDLIAALGETIGTMRPMDLTTLTRELLQGGECVVDGMPLYPVADDVKFNEVFKGKPLAAWRLLLFALQVNYADFSLALGGSEAKPSGAATPSPVSATSVPSGPSGA